MTAPKVLDLFCCQGGASRGYQDAGYEVVGVDLFHQPRYPFPFKQADALDVLEWLLTGAELTFRWNAHVPYTANPSPRTLGLADFDAIHASPPCQAKTRAQRIQGNDHPRLIRSTRKLLQETGLPYVIENVVSDDPENDPEPLIDPMVLCGAMFGIETYRHREFETSFPVVAPAHPEHVVRTTKMGRPPVMGEYMHIVGNFSGTPRARGIMRMGWASRDGLREAIPPVYTEWIGRQLLASLAVSS
jgi:DNA (cytosine-5)-methyltransferase 1